MKPLFSDDNDVVRGRKNTAGKQPAAKRLGVKRCTASIFTVLKYWKSDFINDLSLERLN
jgi:hypothetical protein